MARLGLKIGDFDLIELNEAFASQALACLRQLGLPDDAEHVNPHGGAIALGHPLGMSGARMALTAVHGLDRGGGRLRARHHVRRRRSGGFAGAGAGLRDAPMPFHRHARESGHPVTPSRQLSVAAHGLLGPRFRGDDDGERRALTRRPTPCQ